MVRPANQCTPAGFDHRCSEVYPGRLWVDRNGSPVEGEADHRRCGWRHPKSNHPQANGSAGALRGWLRLSDPVSLDPPGVRPATWPEWSRARERKLPDDYQRTAVASAL